MLTISLLKPKEILKLAKPWPENGRYSIYFLLLEKEIVYIGQSSRVLGRISKHKQSEMRFDSVAILWCDSKEDAAELERLYIEKFKPKHNKSLKGHKDMSFLLVSSSKIHV